MQVEVTPHMSDDRFGPLKQEKSDCDLVGSVRGGWNPGAMRFAATNEEVDAAYEKLLRARARGDRLWVTWSRAAQIAQRLAAGLDWPEIDEQLHLSDTHSPSSDPRQVWASWQRTMMQSPDLVAAAQQLLDEDR